MRRRLTRARRPTPTPRTPARPATSRRDTHTTGHPATRPSILANIPASTLTTPITRARTASLRILALTGAMRLRQPLMRTIGRLHEYTHGGMVIADTRQRSGVEAFFTRRLHTRVDIALAFPVSDCLRARGRGLVHRCCVSVRTTFTSKESGLLQRERVVARRGKKPKGK